MTALFLMEKHNSRPPCGLVLPSAAPRLDLPPQRTRHAVAAAPLALPQPAGLGTELGTLFGRCLQALEHFSTKFALAPATGGTAVSCPLKGLPAPP